MFWLCRKSFPAGIQPTSSRPERRDPEVADVIPNQVGSVDMMSLCDIEAILISRPKRRDLIREPRFRGARLLLGFNDDRRPFERWPGGPSASVGKSVFALTTASRAASSDQHHSCVLG